MKCQELISPALGSDSIELFWFNGPHWPELGPASVPEEQKPLPDSGTRSWLHQPQEMWARQEEHSVCILQGAGH